MAGVKGRSGRKPIHYEFGGKEFAYKCKKWLDDNFDNFDTKTKIAIAREQSLKIVPTTQEVNQNTNVTLSKAQDELIVEKIRENLRTKALTIDN